MSTFLWTSGHLGWGIFALVLFSGLWVLLADVYWRLRDTRITRLAGMIVIGWAVGVGLIVLLYWWFNH